MYPSDLTEKEWDLVKDFFEFKNGYGNRSLYPRKVLVDAILYLVKSGCQWRMLPKDLPRWKTVYSYYRRLCKKGIWEKALDHLNEKNRVAHEKIKDPSFAIVDSQSVKTQNKGNCRGIDGGKKNQGKKTTHRN